MDWEPTQPQFCAGTSNTKFGFKTTVSQTARQPKSLLAPTSDAFDLPNWMQNVVARLGWLRYVFAKLLHLHGSDRLAVQIAAQIQPPNTCPHAANTVRLQTLSRCQHRQAAKLGENPRNLENSPNSQTLIAKLGPVGKIGGLKN